MKNSPRKICSASIVVRRLSLVWLAMLLFMAAAKAQTTSFTFPNTLPSEITPVTGTFEMEFKLFDAVTGGTQVGATITVAEVAVNNRAFTVQLDFGAAAFPGADRFVEIGVRRWSDEPFTTIPTRAQILSEPYAMRALSAATADTATSATQLGGVEAGDFVLTNDERLSNPRNPNPGSSNYIQNRTSPQAGANFNIDGDGTAGGTLTGNVVNAVRQYNIGGTRMVSNAGAFNIFVGEDAGRDNSTGAFNSFFGYLAGVFNTTGVSNAFFGALAGSRNTEGFSNSFFGVSAGGSNTTGNLNSFFGLLAGASNTTGSVNSFFGFDAGVSNSTGSSNSFFGNLAGFHNTTGENNAFFGTFAGPSNTTENSNTFIGAFSNGAPSITNATALGAGAIVTQSDSVVLGNNASVGIGTSAPAAKLHVDGSVYVGLPGHGVILKSPNGATCRRLTIDNAGELALAVVVCP